MKKYIIVVFAALVGFSSCEIESGTNRTPNLAQKMIAEQVVESIYPITAYTRFVIYTDALLSGNDDRAKFIKSYSLSAADIVVEDSKIVFTIGNSTHSDKYTLTTDGKLLSEGGVWKISTAYRPEVVFRGIEGVSDCYEINHAQDLYSYFPAESLVEATLSYDVDVDMGRITVSVNGNGQIEEEDSFKTKFDIKEDNPLLYTLYYSYEGIYTSGVIDVLYRDLVTNKEREICVTYDKSGKYFCE